jgi:hypothetical protein
MSAISKLRLKRCNSRLNLRLFRRFDQLLLSRGIFGLNDRNLPQLFPKSAQLLLNIGQHAAAAADISTRLSTAATFLWTFIESALQVL